ncbi:MAG: photosynthetic complex assembly protein PuhC [Alphaproteobacteria bacterium]
MTETTEVEHFPKRILYGVAVLVLVAFTAAVVGRQYDIGAMRTPEGVPVASRDINFVDKPDGSVEVYQIPDDTLIEVLEPGSDNFIRVVMRGFVRERKRNGIGRETPFSLSRWEDGRLMLLDPATGRQVMLNAFGKTNIAAFARLLEDDGGAS